MILKYRYNAFKLPPKMLHHPCPGRIRSLVPDAVLHDPTSKRVITFNHRTNDGTSIDPATEKVVGTIDFGGEPQAAVADVKGYIFVNVRSSSEIAEFDARTLKISNYDGASHSPRILGSVSGGLTYHRCGHFFSQRPEARNGGRRDGRCCPRDVPATQCPTLFGRTGLPFARCLQTDKQRGHVEDSPRSPSSPERVRRKRNLRLIWAIAVTLTGAILVGSSGSAKTSRGCSTPLLITTGAPTCRTRGNWLRRSPSIERQSGSSPITRRRHNNLGLAWQDERKLPEAIAEFREAIRLEPNFAPPHSNLAWALVQSPKRPRDDYNEGLAHARKAVELEPKNRDGYRTLALVEYRLGHWPESLGASKESLTLKNGGDAFNWFLHVLAHGQKGDKDEARKWFDKAVEWTRERDPKNAEAAPALD